MISFARIALSLTVLLLAFSPAAVPGSAMAQEPIDIGSRLELMVDRHLIESMHNTTLEMHRPQPEEVVMVHDEPWEGNGSGYHVIFEDDGIYRMYYKAWQIVGVAPRPAGNNRLFIAYAESEDGIHWEKPNLGLHEFDGSTDNNIVIPDVAGYEPHDFSVFKDPNADPDGDAVYKGVGFAMRSGALWAFKSPDGIEWTLMNDAEPVMTGETYDTHNIAFWDPNIEKYRAYIRHYDENRIRGIMTSTSDDMINWSPREWLDYGDAPDEALYLNNIRPYYRAPHIYIGFPARYIEREWGKSAQELPNWSKRQQRRSLAARYGSAVSDALLMTSRDGVNFHRWCQAFIRPGLRQNNWAYGDNYPSWHVLETTSDAPGNPPELSLYASEEYFTGNSNKLRRYTLRLDGFVSLNATGEGGEMVTKPLVFDGQSLVLNYATSAAGAIRVELQREDGTPIPGYTLVDCDVIFGDQLDRIVTWAGDADLSDLSGDPVRMRIQMSEADLYSFQFVQEGGEDASGTE